MSRAGRSELKKVIDAFETEFIHGFVVGASRLDDSTRYQQQGRALLQANGWGITGGVGEQSEGKASGTKFNNACAVAQ